MAGRVQACSVSEQSPPIARNNYLLIVSTGRELSPSVLQFNTDQNRVHTSVSVSCISDGDAARLLKHCANNCSIS